MVLILWYHYSVVLKTCSCGGPRRVGGRLCLGCHAAYMRRTRVKHLDLPDAVRRRANARAYANLYIRRGELKVGACEVCGDELVAMHHRDVSKPLEVTWLCAEHVASL